MNMTSKGESRRKLHAHAHEKKIKKTNPPHLASPQTPNLAPPPSPAPPALKRTRPDSPPLDPTTPKATLQADGASTENEKELEADASKTARKNWVASREP
jgi:hypothetical protein